MKTRIIKNAKNEANGMSALNIFISSRYIRPEPEPARQRAEGCRTSCSKSYTDLIQDETVHHKPITRLKNSFFAILIVGLLFTACSPVRSERFESADYAASEGVMLRSAAPVESMKSSPRVDNSLIIEEGRKKILYADLRLEVRNLDGTERALNALVSGYEGWVDRSAVYETSLSLTLRIPVERLEQFLSEAGALGQLKSKSISADDVTDYYFDTSSRLETLNILKERYTAYLKNAGNMEDILSIERELNDTIAEIESMERTIRRLDGQISYATINFYAELPAEERVDRRLPNVMEGLKRFGYGFIAVLYYIGIGLLYAVVYGVPILLALGLLYFIGFGRLGLVRRFFHFLGRKRKKNTP